MADEPNPFASVLGELFGRSVDLTPEPVDASSRQVAPSFAGVATALLDGFGLASPEHREGADALIEDALERVGLDAHVGGLRFGVLTLEATSVTARLLQFESDRLLAALRTSFPGEIERVNIRVQRPRRGRRGGESRPRHEDEPLRKDS